MIPLYSYLNKNLDAPLGGSSLQPTLPLKRSDPRNLPKTFGKCTFSIRGANKYMKACGTSVFVHTGSVTLFMMRVALLLPSCCNQIPTVRLCTAVHSSYHEATRRTCCDISRSAVKKQQCTCPRIYTYMHADIHTHTPIL